MKRNVFCALTFSAFSSGNVRKQHSGSSRRSRMFVRLVSCHGTQSQAPEDNINVDTVTMVRLKQVVL